MTDILQRLAALTQKKGGFYTHPCDYVVISALEDATKEIECLRKLAAESRDALDAAIPCIGRDSSSFSTQYALRQVKEQRERCELALTPQEPAS